MVIIGTKLEDSKAVAVFFMKTKERIKNNNFMKNPFTGDVSRIDNGTYIVKIDPIYFPFPLLMVIPFLICFFIWGWSNWLLIPLGITTLYYFWMPHFYKTMLAKGLRKAGVEGKIVFMTHTEIIEEVVFKCPKGI